MNQEHEEISKNDIENELISNDIVQTSTSKKGSFLKKIFKE